MSLAVGDTLPPRTFGPQTRTDIVRYQGASGDFNPIHHDDDFAKAGGMPGAFSVGMLQAGYIGTYCVDQFGPTSIRRILVRFVQQVWPGDELTCTGVVASVDPGDGETVLDLSINRADGTPAVTAAVTLRISNH